MNMIENIFGKLIDEFDNFLTTEEQIVGCLENDEHSNFISMRNYINDVFIKKLNESNPKPQTECKQEVRLAYIPFLEDDDDGMDICKKKRSQEYEK